jgi:hypothetical protein
MVDKQIDNKTIEELENDYWPIPSSFPTTLVEKVFLLRQKRISYLNADDIRLLISQNIGTKYLMPKALALLRINIVEEALYYPGDLLMTLLKSDKDYWVTNNFERKDFIALLDKSRHTILNDAGVDEKIKRDLINSIDDFINSVPV